MPYSQSAAVATSPLQPALLPRYQISGWSRVGQRGNSDAWVSYLPKQRHWLRVKGAFFAVADSVGPQKVHALASRRAVETTMRFYYMDPTRDPTVALLGAVRRANADLYAMRRWRPEFMEYGSTLCAAVVFGGRAVVANVGDSRAYLVRPPHVWQLTRDHTWLAEYIGSAAGVIDPRQFSWSGDITRALGAAREVDADLYQVSLRPGDALVLCSDGVSDRLAAAEIGAIVERAPSGHAAVWLVGRAGNADSATSVVVEVLPPLPAPPPPRRAPSITRAHVLRPPLPYGMSGLGRASRAAWQSGSGLAVTAGAVAALALLALALLWLK